MADDVMQDVYHRVHFYEKNGRRFTVRIQSDRHGYSGRLLESLSDEDVVPASLNFPPQLEIDPTSFYKDRRGLRAELVRLINEELDAQRVSRLDAEGARNAQDPFIRANLEGWPNGYPGVVEDDLGDWIDVTPHWHAS
ncbi:hypothetical protein [Burkholderia sp. 3C]